MFRLVCSLFLVCCPLLVGCNSRPAGPTYQEAKDKMDAEQKVMDALHEKAENLTKRRNADEITAEQFKAEIESVESARSAQTKKVQEAQKIFTATQK